jgi:carbonic anhydrase
MTGSSSFRSGALQRGIFGVAYPLNLRNNSAETSDRMGCVFKVRPSSPERTNFVTVFSKLKGAVMKCKSEISPTIDRTADAGENAHQAHEHSSRRGFLQITAGGALAGLAAAAGFEFAAPRAVLAQSKLTPDAALQELMDGNKRFASGRMTAFEQDLAILKQNTVEKQEPFASVLSCADSRVPVELVFDQTIGHIFVNRVAGNILTPEIIGSIEYGAAVLGTKVILVMGHGNCGAVKAAIYGKDVPGQISSLFPHIQPAVDQAGHDLEAAIRANAKIQAALLRESSPVIAGLLKEAKVKVVAAYYDIANGNVKLLE